MLSIKGIDCHFCQASRYDRMITEEQICGDCLEDIGVVIPKGGIAVVDRTIFPRVGDLVICCRKVGSLNEYLKQVFSFDTQIIVGTRYTDKTRDFTFKAVEIRGVVRYIMDENRKIIWESDRLKEQGENNRGVISKSYDFTTSGNAIRLKEIKYFDGGTVSEKTALKVKHRPLERCPHCGGITQIEFANEFGSARCGFVAKCKRCESKSGVIYEGETLLLQKGVPQYGYVSFEAALNRVIDKWNARYKQRRDKNVI